MFGLKTMSERAELVTQMARKVDADLGEAVLDGKIGANSLRAAVVQCAACSETQACRHWLATHDTAAKAPDYCRNHDLFEAIKS